MVLPYASPWPKQTEGQKLFLSRKKMQLPIDQGDGNMQDARVASPTGGGLLGNGSRPSLDSTVFLRRPRRSMEVSTDALSIIDLMLQGVVSYSAEEAIDLYAKTPGSGCHSNPRLVVCFTPLE